MDEIERAERADQPQQVAPLSSWAEWVDDQDEVFGSLGLEPDDQEDLEDLLDPATPSYSMGYLTELILKMATATLDYNEGRGDPGETFRLMDGLNPSDLKVCLAVSTSLLSSAMNDIFKARGDDWDEAIQFMTAEGYRTDEEGD